MGAQDGSLAWLVVASKISILATLESFWKINPSGCLSSCSPNSHPWKVCTLETNKLLMKGMKKTEIHNLSSTRLHQDCMWEVHLKSHSPMEPLPPHRTSPRKSKHPSCPGKRQDCSTILCVCAHMHAPAHTYQGTYLKACFTPNTIRTGPSAQYCEIHLELRMFSSNVLLFLN